MHSEIVKTLFTPMESLPLPVTILQFRELKKLNGIAFRAPFVLSRLLRPKVTESMTMLENDTEQRAGLEFTLNTYGMDLSEYVFNN
jgi:hypothetical protein